ncbi:MAG: CGNR zinc finger domain-containing protein [Proteobacteria bacterium]|nr:CGNR zinc finger domain-containing protein [Pseudomonadota bacterium]
MSIHTSYMSPVPFDRCGGHPALDFVNTLDHRFDPERRTELLGDYAALLRFAREAGLLDPSRQRVLADEVAVEAGARALRSAIELREAMASVLYAQVGGRDPASADLDRLGRCFQEAERPENLRWVRAEGGAPARLEWQWRPEQLRAPALPVGLLAQAASELMLSDALARVRHCEADTCRWLFLDTSKNHTRRWCNMKVCGNRAKARRFQQRRAN